MKKMMFYLVLLSLMAACRKSSCVDCRSPTNDLALCKELIIGKWEWVRTVATIDTFATYTPKTFGHSVTLNFKTDGILENYVDGQLKDTSSYEVYDVGKFFKPDSGQTYLNIKGCVYPTPNPVRFYTYVRAVRLKICDDSLYLPYDRFYHSGNDFYVRAK
jgi:hypothetical protein